jgi:hypothetical protein
VDPIRGNRERWSHNAERVRLDLSRNAEMWYAGDMPLLTQNQETNTSKVLDPAGQRPNTAGGTPASASLTNDEGLPAGPTRILGRPLGLFLVIAAQMALAIYIEKTVVTWGHPGFKDDYLSVFDAFDFLDIAIAAVILLPIAAVLDRRVLKKRLRLVTTLVILAGVAVGWSLTATWLLSVFHPFRDLQL